MVTKWDAKLGIASMNCTRRIKLGEEIRLLESKLFLAPQEKSIRLSHGVTVVRQILSKIKSLALLLWSRYMLVCLKESYLRLCNNITYTVN